MSLIKPKNQKQKGISVLYVVFIASILLAIGLGISAILIQQIKMMREIGYSVVAFYAADSGIERVLVDRQNPNLGLHYYSCYSLSSPPCSLDNGSTYQVFVTSGGTSDCPDADYCIKSIGAYMGTKRAIEISY